MSNFLLNVSKNSIDFTSNGRFISIAHKTGCTFFKTTEVLKNTQPVPNHQSIDKSGSEILKKEDVKMTNCLISERYCNLMAHVNQSDPRVLHIHNIREVRAHIASVKFEKSVIAVRMNKMRLIAVLEDAIHIFAMGCSKLIGIISNMSLNTAGVIDLSFENHLIAYPTGCGRIQLYDTMRDWYIMEIQAHKSDVSCVKFNEKGDLVATASVTSTVIRIFDVYTGDQKFEFRRGLLRNVSITSLSFSSDSKFLGCSSNSRTVHVYKLETPAENTETNINWMKNYAAQSVAPYLPTQVSSLMSTANTTIMAGRSFANAELPMIPKHSKVKLFMEKNTINAIVITSEGFAFLFKINQENGSFCFLKQICLVDEQI